ncbi:hypothetical protein NFI96_020310 [Prochilodus magdalenae]|nr:hypothetical protein NFI96_020310 [Prochilodus magdalenae]
MTKLQLLHRALNERLMAAVEQIMEMVGGTVLEYEAETIRARKENETLRRRLRWMEGEIPTDWPDEVDPCVPEQPVSLAEEPVFEGLAIKTEPVDAFDCPSLRPDASLPASVCTTDLETVNPATSEPANVGLPNGTTWDSSQNYMAPLDFEPTMAGNWRGRGRSQRMSFACPDCGKVFGREQRLIFHMRIHSAERPYTYRRRKACFYGDKKRRKKLHGLSKLYLSKEIVEDLSDTSEQTERSTGSANVSAPRTAAPSAPEAETDKDLDKASKVTGNSKYPENTTAKPVGHKSRQGPGKSKILRCLECKKAFKSVSRLAVHMKTHRKSFPRGQEDTDKTDKRPRQHPKKPTMRNNEMEVERARAGGHSLFQCLECKKIFARSCWLTFHLKSHDRERALTHKEQKRFPSKKMQKNITQVSTEVTEETKVAENSRAVRKVFPCPFCDKVFTREGWLGPHIRNHAVKMPPKRDILLQNILTGSRKKSQRTISQLLIEVTDDRKKMNRELKRKSETASDPPPTKIVASHKMTLESNKTRESKTSSNDSEGILEESKKITEEAERIPEESASEAQSIPKSKKTFPCRECGKVYLLPGCLKTHKKIHKRERMQKLAQKKMKEEEEQSLVEGMMGNIVEKKRRKKKKLLEIQPSLNNVGQTKTLDTAVMLPEETADKSSHKKAPENKKKESTNTTKGRFVCKHCGKVYTRRNWLNMHMLGHGKAVEKTENIEEQKSDDGQAAQDSSSAEESTVQKEQDGGKVSYPCPFCDKVFGRGMRLMVHMQVHSSEKPYSYRQRKEQYYGDLTRPRVPDTYSQEPAVESSDEREKDGGFALTRNQTSTMSQDHTSTTEPKETVQPHSVCTGRKFSLLPLPSADAASSHSMDRSRTDSESVSTATSHFSLQPRIVLEPISAKFEHCAAPGKGDFQLVSAETSDKEPYKVSDASTSRTVDYPGNCYPSSQKAYDSQSVLSGMRSSVIPETDDPGTVCVNLGSDCKSFENTSNPEKTLTPTVKPQYSGPPMGTISWSGKSCSVDTVSLSESEKRSNDRALLMKCAGIQLTRISESVLSGSSSVAMQQVAYPKSSYVNLTDVNSDYDDDDDDDGDDSSNVSHNVDEKKTLTEGKMQAIKLGVKDAMSKQPARIHTKVEPVSSFLCWDSSLDQTASEILTETGTVDSSFPRSLQNVADAASDIQFIPDEAEEQSAERHEMVVTSVKQTKENSKGQCRSSTCMICGLIFVGRRALSQHMQVHSTACISKTPSTLKTFKNMVKNNETKAKQDGDIQTSDVPKAESTDISEVLRKSNSAAVMESKTTKAPMSSGRLPEIDMKRQRSKSGSKTLTRELEKKKKTAYCRFCNKTYRKMELHLKYDHPREPEVIEALDFGKTREERKELLSRLSYKKSSECDAHNMVDGDLVHCLFCQGSYRRNQFWKHALICEQKEPKIKEELTLTEATSPVQQALQESLNASLPDVELSIIQNSLSLTSADAESGSTDKQNL